MRQLRHPIIDWLMTNGYIDQESIDSGFTKFPDGTQASLVTVQLPVITCRYCGKLLLIKVPGVSVGPAEYAEKVVLHEGQCAQLDW